MAKQLPSFVRDNVDRMFEHNFQLFRDFHCGASGAKSKSISEYIQKNILNIDSKKKGKSIKLPGQVRFEKTNLTQNFRTLHFVNYKRNEALLDTLVDFTQLPCFSNLSSSYYYTRCLQATKRESKGSVKALRSMMSRLEFEPESHPVRFESVSGQSYKKKYVHVINTDPRDRLGYLQRLMEIEARYSEHCKSFLSNLSSLIQKKNKEIVQKMVVNPKSLKFLGLTEEQIENMYYEFFYSEINDRWFKKETFLDDKIFRISCEVLSFLSIEDLTRISNFQTLEIHLKSSIDMLKELDFTFALEHKFAIIHKVLENISYLIHYVNETKILPGNEEILVVFIWCVIQAKCETMKSNFRFLQLFVNDDQKLGELGFAITQLEAAIMYIGEPNQRTCPSTRSIWKTTKMSSCEVKSGTSSTSSGKGTPGPKPPST